MINMFRNVINCPRILTIQKEKKKKEKNCFQNGLLTNKKTSGFIYHQTINSYYP